MGLGFVSKKCNQMKYRIEFWGIPSHVAEEQVPYSWCIKDTRCDKLKAIWKKCLACDSQISGNALIFCKGCGKECLSMAEERETPNCCVVEIHIDNIFF